MVTLYSDLVELGLRVLENPKAGEIAVPSFLKTAVKQELDKRAAMSA